MMDNISAHLRVRSNTSQRARRSDITPASHTAHSGELFGVQAAARAGGHLRAMAWRKGCECVRCDACADGEERDLVRCRRTSRPPLAACLSVRARSTSHKPAAAGRADDLRPPRDPFASGSVAALHVRTLLSRRRSRGPLWGLGASRRDVASQRLSRPPDGASRARKCRRDARVPNVPGEAQARRHPRRGCSDELRAAGGGRPSHRSAVAR